MKKQSVWVLWLGSLAAWLLGSGWIATAGMVVFGFLVVAHLAEFFMNYALFQKEGGSMANHFIQTMIYGLFHWTPIKERFEAENGDAAS